MSEQKSLKERAAEELLAFFYITLYFWVLALTFQLTQRVTLREAGADVVHNGFAIVTALVLAKVALITEAVYKKRRVGQTRLVVLVVKHSLVLTLVLIAFSLLEEAVKSLLHGGAFGALLTPATERYVLAKAAVFFVALIPFCAFQELARIIGPEKLKRMFLAPGGAND